MMAATIGALTLLLLAWDVFTTVFSAEGRGGPFNRRQNRAMWRISRALAHRRDGTIRDRWLALAGPWMVLMTLGVWVLWLILGFALVYYPWMQSFLVSPGTLRTPALEALYYSGYTAATLGLGDLVADAPALRLLAPVEAFGGFLLLSASVTYFLAVYREVIRKQALAFTIAGYFGANEELVSGAVAPDAGGDGWTGAGNAPEALARWGESVSSGLAHVLLAHHQYPVLHFFRSPRCSRSLAVQLGHLIQLSRRVADGADDLPGLHALARHPSYRALQGMVERYLHEVERLFTPGDRGSAEPDDGSGDALERAHRRLLEHMLRR